MDLKSQRANKREFTSVIHKKKPKLIVLNGHGTPDAVFWQDDEMIIRRGENESILKDAIVYARSCSSAKNLGKQAVKAGAHAYIGYTEDFIFYIEDAFISKPLSDKTAALFLEPANQIAVSLLKGHTAGEADRRSKQAQKRVIGKLVVSSAHKGDSDLVPFLYWNMSHQVCLGNPTSAI